MQRKDPTRSNRPAALAAIVPMAGREAGSMALKVVVDIPKMSIGSSMSVAAECDNEEDVADDKIKEFCSGRYSFKRDMERKQSCRLDGTRLQRRGKTGSENLADNRRPKVK